MICRDRLARGVLAVLGGRFSTLRAIAARHAPREERVTRGLSRLVLVVRPWAIHDGPELHAQSSKKEGRIHLKRVRNGDISESGKPLARSGSSVFLANQGAESGG